MEVCTVCWNARKLIHQEFIVDKDGTKICKKSSQLNRHEFKALRLKKEAKGEWEEEKQLEPFQVSNYRTEMCKHLTQFGKCTYGARCRFAHSAKEMETNRARYQEEQRLVKGAKASSSVAVAPPCPIASVRPPAPANISSSTPQRVEKPNSQLSPRTERSLPPRPATPKAERPSLSQPLPPKLERPLPSQPMRSRLADYLASVPSDVSSSTMSTPRKPDASTRNSPIPDSPVLSSGSSGYSNFWAPSAASSRGMERSPSASSHSSCLSQPEDSGNVLLTILKESGAVPSVKTVPGTLVDQSPTACQWCDTYLAVTYCEKCELFFCQPCGSRRHSRGIGVTHVVQPLFVGQDLDTCAACASHRSAYFCSQCSIFYCQPCLAQWHSRGEYVRHKWFPVPESASEDVPTSLPTHTTKDNLLVRQPGEPVLDDPMLSLPLDFVCPITHEVMKHPVMTEDGHSYERSAIEAWLQHHDTSPKTNLPLNSKRLLDNQTLRAAISSWMHYYSHLTVVG